MRAGPQSNHVVAACRERSDVSTQSLHSLEVPEVVVKRCGWPYGEHAADARVGCTILTRMTTLVREIIKSEGAPDRAPAEPGVAGRCPISTLQTFTALKGRRAHAHPSHDAARSPSWHAGSCAGGCEGRHRRSHRKGREAHTTGARRPASCPSVENVRYENVLTTKPDLHEVSTVSFVVGTSCGARWPTAIVHEVLFHNMRHKRRRVV